MKIDPNAPAYPQPLIKADNGSIYRSEEVYEFSGGMTIRDAFAMAAMQGLLANDQTPGSEIARDAVDQADALIARLNKVSP